MVSTEQFRNGLLPIKGGNMTEHNKLEATFARAHAQPAARRKTTLRSAALLGASLIGLMAAVPAHADETSDLRAQIDALSRRLAAMESREKAAAAAKPPKPTAAPVVAAAPAAPSPEVITLNQRVTKLETAAATPSAIAPGTPAGLTTNQNGNMLGSSITRSCSMTTTTPRCICMACSKQP